VRSNLDGSVARQDTEEQVVAWIRERKTPVSLLTDILERERKNDSPNAAAEASKCASPRNFLLYSWSVVRSRPDVMFGGKEGLEAVLQGVVAAAVRIEGLGRGEESTRGGVLPVTLGEGSGVRRHERGWGNRNSGGLPNLCRTGFGVDKCIYLYICVNIRKSKSN